MTLQANRRKIAARAAFAGVVLLTAACGSATPTASPWRPPPRSPALHLDIADACPAGLGAYRDVTNRADGLTQHMVPGAPRAAHVCRYHEVPGYPDGPAPQPGVLYTDARLSAEQATQLASALDEVDDSPPPAGPVGCPAEMMGTATILVFGYGFDSVDVWYADTGCQTVDNGYIGAWQGSNLSFGRFQDALLRALA